MLQLIFTNWNERCPLHLLTGNDNNLYLVHSLIEQDIGGLQDGIGEKTEFQFRGSFIAV